MSCALALVTSVLTAGDVQKELPAATLPDGKPGVEGNLPTKLWSQLGPAFRLAQKRIQFTPACSSLFGDLKVDGLELLASVRFTLVSSEKDKIRCVRGVAALTEVRGHQIRLCPLFASLSVSSAALIVIHELLHSGGMSESPPDPMGLTAEEISRRVKARCVL
jgi:hypothetical protein